MSPSGERLVPPGYYPDPRASVPSLRWWDGQHWTDVTAPVPPSQWPQGPWSPTPPQPPPQPTSQPPSPPAPRPPRRWGPVKWSALGVFLLVVGVVVVALARGQQVCSVDTKGVVTFAGKDGQCLSAQQVQQAQATLEAQVENNRPVDTASGAGAGRYAGWWSTPEGIAYLIVQGGTEATIAEYTPGIGLSASGVGTVDASGVTFRFQAIDGSTGTASYRLVDAGHLQGTVHNALSGATITQVLTASR